MNTTVKMPTAILKELELLDREDIRAHELLYIGMSCYQMYPTSTGDYLSSCHQEAYKLLSHSDDERGIFKLHELVDVTVMNTTLIKVQQCITTYILSAVGLIENAKFKELSSMKSDKDTMVFDVVT